MTAPRLRIITGKGGVGKTTVACALAMAEVLEGRRVLLAEVNGKDRVSHALGFPPVGAQLQELVENLWVVDMNPADTIHEYALLILKFEVLYRAVFENRLVRPFVRLVPSLGELVMLGKLWYHEQEEAGGRPRFDVLIVDAPATGHARALLGTPAAVEGTVPAGPLRDNARLIQALLTDQERTCMHVVTTAEEMPVNEALELFDAAERLGIGLGVSIINQHLAPLSPEGVPALRAAAASGLGGLAAALERREHKRLAGEEQLARLPRALRDQALRLPLLSDVEEPRQRIDALAHMLIDARRAGSLS